MQGSGSPVIIEEHTVVMTAQQVEVYVLKKNLSQYKFPQQKRRTSELATTKPQHTAPPNLNKSKSASLLIGIKQLLKKGSKETM
jgi:hypothetical protein